jgi:hypothetical protein
MPELRDYQKEWEFLTELLWGHIHEWEKKARDSKDRGDPDLAFGRKACADDLRFAMRLWGPPEPKPRPAVP